MKKIALLASLLLPLAACTDASMAKFSALGDEATVTCYSGGQTIYEGESTGAVSATQNSDGWQFMEKASREFVRVSGTCVIRSK